MLSGSASATDIPTTVNIKPSLSISLPSNTISIPLDPSGNDFGTSNTTITVATNNPNGYKLYLSSNTTDLTNATNNTYTIPTLTSSTSESNFPANHWGYKLGTDTTANYLPYQSDALISESTTATNGISSTATFAAKVDYTKPAGLYSLAFDLKTIPIVTQTYMQNMDPNICKTDSPTIVIDSRDEQIYTIRRIAGTCWMIDNLRLGYNAENQPSTFNLTTSDSDVDTDTTLETYDLLSDGGTGKPCYGYNAIINGFTTPCIHSIDTTNNRIGVWYNYALATANTINFPQGTTDLTEAEHSICPRGWTLPSEVQITTLTTSLQNDASIFNPVVGGIYYDGTIGEQSTRSTWWSSVSFSNDARKALYYYSSSERLSLSSSYRRTGVYIRCVLRE